MWNDLSEQEKHSVIIDYIVLGLLGVIVSMTLFVWWMMN